VLLPETGRGDLATGDEHRRFVAHLSPKRFGEIQVF
jgi:hypothetical protein